ncbi:MAG: FAD-dependent thymidylate synthase [Spirochaetia bacterium]|jgi:thymidylate synthase (FAD)|nr:FAD-dependent thymidylate synthase [Spirochaetia bacterium]
MAHCIVPAAEDILDKEFPVLDKGFVRLVDYLGGDERIVQAARVSYGKGTKSYREDRGLISYLLRNRHTSPFEQVVFTFHVKLPVFVARQWVRHRTARLNEISGRYSVMKDEFYVPAAGDLAAQSTDNRQGRGGEALSPEKAAEVLDILVSGQKRTYAEYERLLGSVAREIARINLPLSFYTEWYWQIDLHNLLHFLRLRLDAHAQKEIRLYAEVLYGIAKKVCPLALEAFEEHEKGAVVFSAKEFAALKALLAGAPAEACGLSGKDLGRFREKLATGRQA